MAKSYFQGYADSLTHSRDFIGFTRTIYNMVGRNAPCALILYRLTYWHGTDPDTHRVRLRVQDDGYFWVAKNYSDWEWECCVNESTARKALDRLEKLGIIVTKIGKFGGKNSLFIRIIPERFEELADNTGVSVQNGHLVSVQNGHLHIQDNTTEQEEKINTIVAQLPVETTVATSLHTTPNPKAKKPRTPKTSEPLIVNLTNEQLKRERPANMDETEYTAWIQVKPAWELMAIWVTWNLKKGAYHGWEHYINNAVKMEQDRIYRNIQDMGKWLHALAKEAGFTLTYEWLKGFDQWYLDEIVCGLDEVKYPTKRETFYKNFSLYVNYLHQQENDNER